MANFHTIPNEISTDLDDISNDPDLEARLYAEIYYSNESYDTKSQLSEEPSNPHESDHLSQSLAVIVPNESTVDACHLPQNKETSFVRKQNYIFGEARDVFHTNNNQQSLTKRFVKAPRLLAQKDLWLPRQPGIVVRPPARVQIVANPTSQISPSTDKPIAAQKPAVETIKPATSHSKNSERLTECLNENVATEFRVSSIFPATKKKSKTETKKNVKMARGRKAPREKKNQKFEDTESASDAFTEPSKYNVVSKAKKQELKIYSEPVDISSDSDESILEVPVPPKAPPPVIQLPDSDEEDSNNDGARQDRETNKKSMPCYILETDSSSSNESSKSANRAEKLANFNRINDEATRGVRVIPEIPDSPASPEPNLILNCTDIQRGAASLDDIRQMREAGASNRAHSDDSMTESEANNWTNIAERQSNDGRYQEDYPNDRSIYSISTNLFSDQFPSHCDEIRDSPRSPDPECNAGPSSVTAVVTNTSKRNQAVVQSTSTSFNDFEVPAIPQKRSKRSVPKSSREQTNAEYFFKPMSKELRNYYNNPGAGEHLDVYDIQNKMPKNPSRWRILDADLHGPTSRRRKLCPRCRSDMHIGKRCPEKAKSPNCYMCGVTGHTESRCPRTMCLTCGRKHSTYRPTCGYCVNLYCEMCGARGHVKSNCPDIWRRYHNTTTQTVPLVPRDFAYRGRPKTPNNLVCCNCTKRGHDVTTCKQLRWSQHFPTPMYVSNYTQGPIYEPTHDQRIQEEDTRHPSENDNPIEVPVSSSPRKRPSRHKASPLELSKPVEPLILPELSEPPQPTIASNDLVIFQCGDIDLPEVANWFTVSRRLNDVKNAHLTALMEGTIQPTFLKMWCKDFKYALRITQVNNTDDVTMILKSKNQDLFASLELVIQQWLTRPDDEKPNLIYDEFPYKESNKLITRLYARLEQFKRCMEPTVLLKEIANAEEQLRRLFLNTKKKIHLSAKKMRRRQISVAQQTQNIMKKRELLISSLYSRSFVDGGKEIVDVFRSFPQRIQRNQYIEPSCYLELVHVFNEMFTFHVNDKLTKALDKAILSAERNAEQSRAINAHATAAAVALSEQPRNNVMSNDAILPTLRQAAERAGNYSCETLTQRDEDALILDKNPLQQPSLAAPPKSPASSIMPSLVTSDPLHELPTISDDIHHDESRISEINSQRLDQPKLQHQDSQSVEVENFVEKKGADDKHLIQNLPKKRRKIYRNSANKVIKLAHLTKKPHLIRMAQDLAMKMKDGSARIHDVHLLQSSVFKPHGMKMQPKKKQCEQRPIEPRQLAVPKYDAVYLNFIKSL